MSMALRQYLISNERLSQYSHLPKVVISLIDDGWKHVLKLRLLQKGLDSPEWRDSVQLLEQAVLQAIESRPDTSHIIEQAILPAIPAEKKIISDEEALEKATQRVTVLVKELIHPWLNSTPCVDDHSPPPSSSPR